MATSLLPTTCATQVTQSQTPVPGRCLSQSPALYRNIGSVRSSICLNQNRSFDQHKQSGNARRYQLSVHYRFLSIPPGMVCVLHCASITIGFEINMFRQLVGQLAALPIIAQYPSFQGLAWASTCCCNSNVGGSAYARRSVLARLRNNNKAYDDSVNACR